MKKGSGEKESLYSEVKTKEERVKTKEEKLAREQAIRDKLYVEKKVDEVIGTIDAENWIHHGNFLGMRREGTGAHADFPKMLLTAFPAGRSTIPDVVDDGEMTVTRFVWAGVHEGEIKTPWLTLPPTGRRISFTGITWSKIVDGRVVERWEEWNALESLIDLGVIPPPPWNSPLVESGKPWPSRQATEGKE